MVSGDVCRLMSAAAFSSCGVRQEKAHFISFIYIIHVCVSVCVSMRVLVCVSVCACACVWVNLCVCTCVRMLLCV